MAEPRPDQPPVNGRYVTRFEWESHIQWARDELMKLQGCDERHAGRIDRLERNWDRYAGPVVALLAILGVIATTASIASAIVLGKAG